MLKGCARIVIATVLIVGYYASSEDAKSAKICGGQQKCDELQRLYVMDAYKSAILAQVEAQNAQQRMQDAMAHYNEQVKALTGKEAQPEGTSYQPDVNKGTVVAVPPKVEPKTEKK